jgi:hypothetical protein
MPVRVVEQAKGTDREAQGETQAHPGAAAPGVSHDAKEDAVHAAADVIQSKLSAPLPDWDPDTIKQLQSKLVDLGEIDYDFTTYGALTPETIKALDKLVSSWRSRPPRDVWLTLDAVNALVDAPKASGPTDAHLPPDFDHLLDVADARLDHYLTHRGGNPVGTTLGPNMDATNYYRIGDMGTDGFGMNADMIAAAKIRLQKAGFPMVDRDELRLVNATDYAARRRQPHMRLAAKHFPGGSEMLEATERDPVHFDDPSSIQAGVQDFARIIQSGAPPELVMMGHASYDRRGFGLSDEQAKLPAAYGDAKFEDLPASLNPGIVGYLRHTLGFHGLVVADWYDMGAILHFFESHPALRITPSREVDIAIFATLADVDLISGLHMEDMANADALLAAAKHKGKLPPDFSAKLEASMQRIWSQKKEHRVAYHPGALSDGEKLVLKSESASQGGYSAVETLEQRHPEKRALYVEFLTQGTTAHDHWNRTGVVTLIQRQLVVEELTHKHFAPLPHPSPNDEKFLDENRWFNQLMKDAGFRAVYDKIDWNSAEAHAAYARAYERRLASLGDHAEALTSSLTPASDPLEP